MNNQVLATEISIKHSVVNLRKWINHLLNQWKWVLLFAFLGGVLGFMYAYNKQTIYIAKTTFVLEDGNSDGGLGQYAGIASMAGIDISGGGGLFKGDNILELYKSRRMIQQTLLKPILPNKQALLDIYVKSNKLDVKWFDNPRLKTVLFERHNLKDMSMIPARIKDSIIGEVVKNINRTYLFVSKPDKNSSIIEVEVRSENELFSKFFNDEIVNNVNIFYTQTKIKKSLDNLKLLQLKTDSVRGVMNRSIYTGASVSDATPNLNPTRQAQRSAPLQRSQFSAEANKAILSELTRNLEMSKIALKRDEPLIQVIDQPIFPLEISKPSSVKAMIIGILTGAFLILLFFLMKKVLSDFLSD